MQVKRVLQSPEHVRRYYEFGIRYELETLRWLGILSLVYMVLLMVIDYWRAQHYEFILVFRGLLIVIFSIVIWISYQSHLSPSRVHLISFSLGTTCFLIGYLLDYFAQPPNFFLANYLCLYLYAFNSALGHPLQYKITQVIFVLTSYVAYAFLFSRNQVFHFSQIWNLLLNASLSLMMGILIERFRLLGFMQQTQLQESGRKIEELNGLKTKLISILSHDLAAPMNRLKGLLKLNDNRLVSSTDFAVHSEKISQTVDNILSLQTNLLRWSKLQLEGFQAIKTPVKLKIVVAEVIESVQHSALEKDIKFIDAIADTTIDTDVEVCKMIARNFLSNAIKFSHPGSNVKVFTSEDGRWLTLCVEDYGVGMSDEQMKNLFEVKKLTTLGTQLESGTGIGLTITKDFVEMIGGKISVHSKEGKGSTFCVSFPKGN